jgi:hypothetical protein
MREVFTQTGSDREGLILMAFDFEDDFPVSYVNEADARIICCYHSYIYIQKFYPSNFPAGRKLPSTISAVNDLHQGQLFRVLLIICRRLNGTWYNLGRCQVLTWTQVCIIYNNVPIYETDQESLPICSKL